MKAQLAVALQVVLDHVGGVALQPAGAVVRARVGAVVGLAGDVQAVALEHLAVLGRGRAERGQEVAHHHAVETRPHGQWREVAEVLDPPAAEAEQRLGQDQAEDRDPLDGLPRVHQLAFAELRPRARDQQVDRHAGRVDRGELERPRRAARGSGRGSGSRRRTSRAPPRGPPDRPQAALVADRARTPWDRSSRPTRRCGAHAGCRLRAKPSRARREVADRDAALEVGVFGDQPCPREDLSKSRLDRPWPWATMQKRCAAGGLGHAGMLERLLGLVACIGVSASA